MALDYASEQRVYRAFKSALTRAVNSKNHALIIAECDRFDAYYNQADKVFPDDWSCWQRARDDARYAQAREKGTW